MIAEIKIKSQDLSFIYRFYKLILIFFLTLIPFFGIYSQEDISLEIEQILIEPEHIFKITGNKFKILERKLYYKRKVPKLKENRIYAKTLDSENLGKIKIILEELINSDSLYSKSVIGDIERKLFIKIDKKENRIKIGNLGVDKTNDLFELINKLIPSNRPKITIFKIEEVIDTILLGTIKNNFTNEKTVNLAYKFGLFDCFGPSETTRKNITILNTVLTYMQLNESVEINLTVHWDCRGNELYNKELTSRIAMNFKKWFLSKGVSSKRINPYGMGEEKPTIKCVECKCSEKEYEANRRIEIGKVNAAIE